MKKRNGWKKTLAFTFALMIASGSLPATISAFAAENEPVVQEEKENTALIRVNATGNGQIAGDIFGDEPEFDEDFPYTSLAYNVKSGDTVKLAAQADDGWVFIEWTDADSGETLSTEEEFEFEADDDLNILAVFEEESEMIDILSDAIGMMAVEHYKDKTGTVPEDFQITSITEDEFVITILGSEDKVLDVYTMDAETGIGTNQSGEVVDLTPYLPKTDATVLIQANVDGQGQIAGNDEGEEPEFDDDYPFQNLMFNMEKGETLKLAAKADEGWDFVEWIDAETDETYSEEPMITIEADEALSLTAVFEESEDLFDDPLSLLITSSAESFYEDMTGETAFATITDATETEFEITLTDDEDNILDVYKINIATGMGTNQAGEEVDLTVYLQQEAYDTIAQLAEECYEALTGEEADAEVTDEKDGIIEITLTDDEGNVLDVYKVDAKTGIGTNQAGEEINLTDYALSEDDYFVDMDNMNNVASKYYEEKNGEYPQSGMVSVDPVNEIATITLYDANGKKLTTYIVDIRTGIGKDENENDVDLSVYKDYHPITEEDYFLSMNLIDDAACGYYNEQTGEEIRGVTIYVNDNIPLMEISVYDSDDKLAAVYTIDPTTGIGTDADGNAVDLAAYANTHEIIDDDEIIEIDESDFFAPVDELCRMAKVDHRKKTGERLQVQGYAYGTDEDGETLIITLEDKTGEPVVTYTIDPKTGLGTNNTEEEVNLPQTGNNSARNLLTALGASFMIALGALTVKRSGIRRKKETEE